MQLHQVQLSDTTLLVVVHITGSISNPISCSAAVGR